MRKDEVEFHGRRGDTPAVNVKVYKSIRDVTLPMHLGSSGPAGGGPMVDHFTDPDFTHEWIDTYLENDNSIWEYTIEDGWEQLYDLAEEIWPDRNVKVFSEGRSGGWAVVEGLPEFDSWDAIELGRWAKFAKWARDTADDIPYQIVNSIYINIWEPEHENDPVIGVDTLF